MKPSPSSNDAQPSCVPGDAEPRGWSAWWPQRIGWRLALGFGVLVVLMLVALAQAIFQIHHITGVTQRFATGDMQRLLRV